MFTPDRAADDIPVQMMLAWALATRLRTALGSNVAIRHWDLQIYHGLRVVEEVDQGVGVTIDYKASIHPEAGNDRFPTLPNARQSLLHLVPPRMIVADIMSELRPAGFDVERQPAANFARTARTAIWDTAFGLIEAMLRLGVQRGYGWRCDSPEDDGYGLVPHLVLPYKSHTSVDLSSMQFDPNGSGYPEDSNQMADWSFLTGADGPVCAIDPNTSVMFPDGGAWPLSSLAEQPAWKAAAAIAARSGATPVPPEARVTLSVAHAIAGEIPMHALLAHEAAGGRIVDHHLYGPLPVMKGSARTELARATGSKIPPDALAWPRPSARLIADSLSRVLPKPVCEDEIPSDVIGLLIVWTPAPGTSDAVVLVVAPESAGASGHAILPKIASHVEVKVIAADVIRDHPSDAGWRLDAEEQ